MQKIRFILCLIILSGWTLKAQQGNDKPNIIIILADDLGYGDVGFNGSDIRTPNLDKLSEEGVVLNRFYVAPVCSPTRAGMLTGRYPNRFGLRQTVIPPWRDFGVDTTEVFLSEALAQAGYKNRAILGKWHLGHSRLAYHPLKRGFTHFYGHLNGAIDFFTHEREGELDWHNDYDASYDKGHSTDLITKEAIKCIEEYSKESPFFMYIAYNAPHGPLQATKEDLLSYGFDETKPRFNKKKGYGEQGRGNTPRQTYAAMVTGMDRGIGEILSKLEELDIDENTLVLFFSDNGPNPGDGGETAGLRGHKFLEWEGGVRVPAVIKWPEGFKGSREIDQVMGYIDVMPTLEAIAGFKSSESKPYDGLNMLPVLTGGESEIERDLYLGYGAIVNNQWKFVSEDTENPKMKVDEDQLFDMKQDPNETANIIDKKEEEADRFEEKLEEYEDMDANFEVPPFGKGRKGFKAPHEWNIIKYPHKN